MALVGDRAEDGSVADPLVVRLGGPAILSPSTTRERDVIKPQMPTAPIAIDENNPDWQKMLQKHDDHRHHHPTAHFLKWHSTFIADFVALLDTLPPDKKPDPASIEPWKTIPDDLKQAELIVDDKIVRWQSLWDTTETQLETKIEGFKDLDALARAIVPPHDFLHGAIGRAYSDPNISSRRTAPWSPYFWRLHRLIERWYQDWLNARPTA